MNDNTPTKEVAQISNTVAAWLSEHKDREVLMIAQDEHGSTIAIASPHANTLGFVLRFAGMERAKRLLADTLMTAGISGIDRNDA